MVNVIIENGKDGFLSKNAINNFKIAVKNNPDIDLDELKKYIKSDYNITKLLHNETDIKFELKLNEINVNKKLLKNKIKEIRNNRTNMNIKKMSTNNDIPEDVITEYKKVKSMINLPLPDPYTIFQNKEQYKPVISNIFENNLITKLPKSHPCIKYLSLIAKHLDIKNKFDTNETSQINNNDTDTEED
jgi:hypothetical protein